MSETLKLLEEILQKGTIQRNRVNNLQDTDNLKVLIWTFSKTGTSTLASSFQHSIDGSLHYKNVTHCHIEECWFRNVSPQLKKINFSFDLLVDFINNKGIKPLVVQSFRCPIKRLMSEANHLGIKSQRRFRNPSSSYIDYLNKTFKGIWSHNYDKDRGFGFHCGDKYDILYVTAESIDKLPENIKLVKDLKEYHNLKIINKNVRKGNGYQKKVIKNLCLSRFDINNLYNIYSEPLNFFYSKNKILEMKDDLINQFAKN
jgi:hypothetical protein